MYQEPDFKSYDYAIGGKLVVGKAVIDESYWHLMSGDQEARKKVKEKLVMDMASFMLENNLVEFMQQKNPMDLRTTVLVRAYIAPNDQVKILRVAGKIV